MLFMMGLRSWLKSFGSLRKIKSELVILRKCCRLNIFLLKFSMFHVQHLSNIFSGLFVVSILALILVASTTGVELSVRWSLKKALKK